MNLDRERVFAYDWFKMEPPETDDFKKATPYEKGGVAGSDGARNRTR